MASERQRWLIWIVIGFAMACSSSGSEDTTGSRTCGACVPGDTKSCACLGGATGVQVCRNDGCAYDPCLCGDGGGPDASWEAGDVEVEVIVSDSGDAAEDATPDGSETPDGCTPSYEICNGLDDDCNGQVDDNAADCTVFYADEDGDGRGDSNLSMCLCAPDWSFPTPFGGDCNDNDPLVSPAVDGDGCNPEGPIDDDCDTLVDEDATTECTPSVIGGVTVTPEDLWYPLDHTVAENTYAGHIHNARDFPAPVGTPIYAAKTGKVAYASEPDNCRNATAPNKCGGANFSCVSSPTVDCDCGGGYGNYITISGFDGSLTKYAHLSPGSILVQVGDIVCAGQPIAAVGASGRVCSTSSGDGAHLHFEYQSASGIWEDPSVAFADRTRKIGGKAFSDNECDALDALQAGGVLDKNCTGYRQNSTCGFNRAGAATALGKLVNVDADPSFGMCDASCSDMPSGIWYYDWLEAATRLERQDATPVFERASTCVPADWLWRPNFLKAALEAAGIPSATTGAAVPDMTSVPGPLKPYVYGATNAGVLSSTTALQPEWVATYGWVATLLDNIRTTQGAALDVSPEDMAPCDSCASACVGHCGSYQGCSCSSCPSGQTCNASNVCVTDCASACVGHCGSYQGCSCSSCPSGQTCNASNVCVPTETCNGIDDDGNGIVDDPASCWRTIYRFKHPTNEARCWNTTTTAPSTCASYQYEREAFLVRTTQVSNTFELVQCSKLTDHILVNKASSDPTELEDVGYDCSLSLGYVYTLGTIPNTPWPYECPLYRFAYQAGGSGAHLFATGNELFGGMSCEPPARASVPSNQECLSSIPSDC